MKKVLALVLAAAVLMPLVATAATPYSIESIGSAIGLRDTDLKRTVINIIQWVLGILAILAVALVIYGGFLWMTSAGNEERVDKGKKVISAALIGLVVVILAWAIVIFIAGTTANVTS